MQNEDKFLIILDKISEISERTTRMEADQRNMKEDLEEVKEQDIYQNQLLFEHIQGVKTTNLRLDNEIKSRQSIESMHADIMQRLQKLEEFPKFKATLKQYIISIGAIASVTVAILKILKYLGY